MSTRESQHAAADRAKFDSYADEYAAIHGQCVAMSGDSSDYFPTYKVRCVERLVGGGFDAPVLDYGCGVGMVTERLCERFSHVDGFDPSAQSVHAARRRLPRATIHQDLATVPDDFYGLVVMSGVLHHVNPAERDDVLRAVRAKLRPGDGRVVVFEHNPFNPLTRRVVATCAFDDDAILLWPWEARRLLVRAGFTGVRREFIFFLPHLFARLRWIEPHLRWLPMGAQVMLVGTRAGAAAG